MTRRQFTIRAMLKLIALCAVYLVAFRHLPRPTVATTATVGFILLGSASSSFVQRLSGQYHQIPRPLLFAVVTGGIACYGLAVCAAVAAVGLLIEP